MVSDAHTYLSSLDHHALLLVNGSTTYSWFTCLYSSRHTYNPLTGFHSHSKFHTTELKFTCSLSWRSLCLLARSLPTPSPANGVHHENPHSSHVPRILHILHTKSGQPYCLTTHTHDSRPCSTVLYSTIYAYPLPQSPCLSPYRAYSQTRRRVSSFATIPWPTAQRYNGTSLSDLRKRTEYPMLALSTNARKKTHLCGVLTPQLYRSCAYGCIWSFWRVCERKEGRLWVFLSLSLQAS